MGKKVLLGLSGGVDSSVAAYLLQKQGYEVTGLYFTITDGEKDLSDFKAVCAHLNLPYVVADYNQIFNQKVLSPFIDQYKKGSTPNICVSCNKFIKFGALLETADELGCDYIATGHYCSLGQFQGGLCLKKAKDEQKDQTYFLAMVEPKVFERVLFPLAGLDKAEVRQIAQEAGLPTAVKKDSSDVCLAEGGKFTDFILKHVPENHGLIKTCDGQVVGKHKGLHTVTLGQRKGLNLGGKSGEDGRWFVVGKDAETNTVLVSHGSQDQLYSSRFEIGQVNLFTNALGQTFDCTVKTRYRANYVPCTVTVDGEGMASVVLKQPERAITVGQYAVFYLDDFCIGGGKISKVY